MKRVLIFSLLSLIVFTAIAQPKTRGRVKRKYRNVERVSQNLPQVVFSGLVRDAAKVPIPGASVEIESLNRRVHTNEFGQFMLSDLPTGRLRLKVSCLGYRTKTLDYVLQVGFNDHYVALDQEKIHLEPLTVTSRNHEQQIPDIPSAISGITCNFSEQLGITGMPGVADFLPGLFYEDLGAGKTAFSIHGSTTGAGFPVVSPSVALFSDEVPVIQSGGFSPEFLDMERIEVLKGPQNTIFGKNALDGAIHLISKKPQPDFGGYVTAGGGTFGAKEAEAAVNVPVVKDMLFVRAAGIYSGRDGYVENTQGGKLNGKNNLGGRFSVRFLPAYNHMVDLSLNYRNDQNSGIAYMNQWIPNEHGETGLYNYRASLNGGRQSGSKQELMDVTLRYRFLQDEHTWWTSFTSFRKSNSSDRWDADGTFLQALDMDEKASAELFYQEIRYNFSRLSRSNGAVGVNYSRENRNLFHGISSNDQLLFELLNSPGNFVMPADMRFPAGPVPLNSSPMPDFPLTGFHREEIFSEKLNQSVETFIHFTYQLRRKLFFNGGARVTYERYQYSNTVEFSEGSPSSLGEFFGTGTNLFYAPSAKQSLTNSSLSYTGQGGFTYRTNEKFNFFVNAVRGRKPKVFFPAWDGRILITGAEIVNSAEAGWNAIILQRVFWNASGFYRRHINVQTLQWEGSPETGLLAANGKATSRGAESGLRIALLKELDLFGNYSWMQSAFDSTGVDGQPYIYAGKSFALAPQHSFSAGMSFRADLLPSIQVFATPWFTWRSHFWFTETNSPGLEQPAFGLLNVNFGLKMTDPNMVLSIFGTNLLEEKYISSAGHWGGILGLPTFVPGPPRMLGAKVKWSF